MSMIWELRCLPFVAAFVLVMSVTDSIGVERASGEEAWGDPNDGILAVLLDLIEVILALPLLFLDNKGGRIGNVEDEVGLEPDSARKVGEGALLDEVVGESVNGGAKPGEEPSSTPLSDLMLRASIDFLFLPTELEEIPLLPLFAKEGDRLGVSGGVSVSSIDEARILAVLSIQRPLGSEIEGGN